MLLKGGREALHTNEALFDIMNDASVATGLPDGWCGLLTTREDVSVMLKMDEDIDLIIRAARTLLCRYIMENSSIPVLGHSDGVCHVYVDADCDAQMAARIVVDAKTQYRLPAMPPRCCWFTADSWPAALAGNRQSADEGGQ